MFAADAEEVAVGADTAAAADQCGGHGDWPGRGLVTGSVEGSQGVALCRGEAVEVGLSAAMVVVITVGVEEVLQLGQGSGGGSFAEPFQTGGVDAFDLAAGLGVRDGAGDRDDSQRAQVLLQRAEPATSLTGERGAVVAE